MAKARIPSDTPIELVEHLADPGDYLLLQRLHACYRFRMEQLLHLGMDQSGNLSEAEAASTLGKAAAYRQMQSLIEACQDPEQVRIYKECRAQAEKRAQHIEQ